MHETTNKHLGRSNRSVLSAIPRLSLRLEEKGLRIKRIEQARTTTRVNIQVKQWLVRTWENGSLVRSFFLAQIYSALRSNPIYPLLVLARMTDGRTERKD